MNEARTFTTSAAERYDRALQRSLKLHPLPPEVVAPQPSRCWPVENVALLEKYRDWLLGIGAADAVINQHRIPMAGHVLGLNCKPHPQLHLVADLEKAMDFVVARKQGQMWQRNCRHSLDWLRRFIKAERGLVIIDTIALADVSHYQAGLPPWLITQLTKLLHIRQANWRPSRMAQSTTQFWYKSTRIWRWLFAHTQVAEVQAVRRDHLFAYIDEQLVAGYKVSTINHDLHTFQGTLRFLQQQGMAIPQALLTLSGLKQPQPLPRFLTEAQVLAVRDDLCQRVKQAKTIAAKRNTQLDVAAFYLLWHCGLRVSELEELCLGDVDWVAGMVLIRATKGMKDRSVYLTQRVRTTLEDYLAVRGPALSDHLFIYRHKPLSKDLIRCRLQAAGKRVGVKVTPHMLRHTFGTQLLNAGAKITTIQALLGHQRLNTTMVYARVHDETVAEDYFAAMAKVEARLAPHLTPEPQPDTKTDDMLTLLDALQAEPLSGEQQALLTVLRHNIEAMAQPQETNPPEQLVTALTAPPNPQAVGLPPP